MSHKFVKIPRNFTAKSPVKTMKKIMSCMILITLLLPAYFAVLGLKNICLNILFGRGVTGYGLSFSPTDLSLYFATL